MKKIILFALCAVTSLFITACANNEDNAVSTSSPGSAAQIANPFAECSTLEEAAELAGFSIAVPDTVNGFNDRVIRTAENQMIEIIYQKDNKEIRIRKGNGYSDLSGDFNSYDTIKESLLNNNTVTLKGNGGTFSLAIWSDGEYSYSVQLSDGTAEDELITLVTEIK